MQVFINQENLEKISAIQINSKLILFFLSYSKSSFRWKSCKRESRHKIKKLNSKKEIVNNFYNLFFDVGKSSKSQIHEIFNLLICFTNFCLHLLFNMIINDLFLKIVITLLSTSCTMVMDLYESHQSNLSHLITPKKMILPKDKKSINSKLTRQVFVHIIIFDPNKKRKKFFIIHLKIAWLRT